LSFLLAILAKKISVNIALFERADYATSIAKSNTFVKRFLKILLFWRGKRENMARNKGKTPPGLQPPSP
jgi:hypothetical protein